MSFEIYATKRFLKEFKKLDSEVQKRIINISVKDTDEDGIEDGPEVYAFFYEFSAILLYQSE